MPDEVVRVPEDPLAIAITGSLIAILVVLTGELDSSNVNELELALASISMGPSTMVRLDLAGLRFCDTTGACVLINFIASTRAKGVRVSTQGASPTLNKIARLIGGPQRGTLE